MLADLCPQGSRRKMLIGDATCGSLRKNRHKTEHPMNQTLRADPSSVHVAPIDPGRMTISYLARRMKDLDVARRECDSLLQKMRTAVGSRALYRAMSAQDAIQILTARIDEAIQIVTHEPGLPLRENSVLDVLRDNFPRSLSYCAIARLAFGGNATPRNLSTIVKNLNAAGWSVSCIHGFGYQLNTLKKGASRPRAIKAPDIRTLARPLPAGVGAYRPATLMADDVQLLGLLSDGRGVLHHVAGLPDDEKIPVLCRIQDYLTCEVSREHGQSLAVSRAVRALRLAYPMTVSGDAIVGLLYDDADGDFNASRLNLNATMKRLRRSGYRIGTVMKRGFCLLDYDLQPDPQSAIMIR